MLSRWAGVWGVCEGDKAMWKTPGDTDVESGLNCRQTHNCSSIRAYPSPLSHSYACRRRGETHKLCLLGERRRVGRLASTQLNPTPNRGGSNSFYASPSVHSRPNLVFMPLSLSLFDCVSVCVPWVHICFEMRSTVVVSCWHPESLPSADTHSSLSCNGAVRVVSVRVCGVGHLSA